MKPDILNYKDYRVYLKDFYQYKKGINPQWSYNAWARMLGISSSSTISMIINGKRNPSDSLVSSFANNCKLSDKETHYFKNLVKIQSRIKDPSLSVILVDEFIEREKMVTEIENSDIALLFNINTAILTEMMKLKDFKNDPKWIEKRLAFPMKVDIESHINRLVKHGIIEKHDGYLITVKNYCASKNPTDEQICNFHQDSLDLVKQSIRLKADDSVLHATTVINISKERMDEAMKLVREFQQRFTQLLDEESGDELMQLNLSVFPLTK